MTKVFLFFLISSSLFHLKAHITISSMYIQMCFSGVYLQENHYPTFRNGDAEILGNSLQFTRVMTGKDMNRMQVNFVQVSTCSH